MTSLIRCTFCEYNTNMYTICSRSLRPNRQELKEIQGFEVFDSLDHQIFTQSPYLLFSDTEYSCFLCYFISFWCLFILNTRITTTTCILRTNQDRIYMEFDTFSLPERAFRVKCITYIVCYRNHEGRLIQKRV